MQKISPLCGPANTTRWISQNFTLLSFSLSGKWKVNSSLGLEETLGADIDPSMFGRSWGDNGFLFPYASLPDPLFQGNRLLLEPFFSFSFLLRAFWRFHFAGLPNALSRIYGRQKGKPGNPWPYRSSSAAVLKKTAFFLPFSLSMLVVYCFLRFHI